MRIVAHNLEVVYINYARRQTMTVPPYDARGLLPPGIHEASWDDVVTRFGSSPPRVALLANLRRALDVLTAIGYQRVWLDGSFVTGIEAREERPPGDVDVCWDLAGVDVERLTAIAPELHPLRGDPAICRRHFGGDYFAVVEPIALGQVEMFQYDRDGERKGIILLVLESS
jgi:hypothetical protein